MRLFNLHMKLSVEFIIAIFDKNEEEVYSVAEEVRLTVAEMRIIHDLSPVSDYITVSIGLATDYICGEDDVEALLEKADSALYKAKSLGRNRVERLIESPVENIM